MPRSISLSSQHKYQIEIFGQPDASWRGWFGDASVHTEIQADGSEITTFTDVAVDQAGLVGLIRRLHGLGIVVRSIRQSP